jgi:hypothetical protein
MWTQINTEESYIEKKEGLEIASPALPGFPIGAALRLEFPYFDSRRSLGALLDFETDAIAFLQTFEAGALDTAMVNKDIFAALNLDKSETFLIVEPLYRTMCHNSSNPSIFVGVNPSRWTRH